jgi:hypothetical protein
MIDLTLKQFKMSNDDELICEVLEWNNEENDALIVRNVLKVVNVEDFEKGIRFYAFRPWMVFIDDPDELHTINSQHIISEVNPSPDIITQYIKAIKELKNNIKLKRKKPSASLDEMSSRMMDMDEEEFESYLDEIVYLSNKDSDLPQNVIKFPPKGTFH